MAKPKEIFRKPRSPLVRVHVETVNDGPSMAKQSFADEVNINKIVSRYADTGLLPPTRGTAQYGEAPDLTAHEAACVAAEAASAVEEGLPTASEEKEPTEALTGSQEPDKAQDEPENGSVESNEGTE
jgi:hypothetical protein